MNNTPKSCLTTDRGGSSRSVPPIPMAVFRTWAMRESVEWEAREQFHHVSEWLKAQGPEHHKLHLMAQQCSEEEMRHAKLCQKLLTLSPTSVPLRKPESSGLLGPENLSISKRVLYTAAALSCVTETLSTALLLEMNKTAEPGLFQSVIKEILEDEIGHSKIGWALLQHFGESHSLSWLSEYIPEMLRTSFNLENSIPLNQDLSYWGILDNSTVREIFFSTTREVIIPGLKIFGVEFNDAWEKNLLT